MTEPLDKTNKTKDFWHTRGYLPHFDDGAVTQFITFRLADSLPKKVLENIKSEFEKGMMSEIEYHRTIDKYLDSGTGKTYLRQLPVANLVIENLIRFDGQKYKLHSWVIMPNHVHLLLTPLQPYGLADIMQRMKSYTAHQANKLIGRTGHFWSKEYFDRHIRNAVHFYKTFEYIDNNPVKTGLCRRPEDWPFGSASRLK